MTGKVITINNEQDLEFYKAVLGTEDLILGDRVTRLVTAAGVIHQKVYLSKDSGLDPIMYAEMMVEHGDLLRELVDL